MTAPSYSPAAAFPPAAPAAARPARAALRDRVTAVLAGPAASAWPTTLLRRTRLNLPLVCLFLYLLIVHSGRLPVAQEVLVLGLLAMPALAGGIRVPTPIRWFAALLVWAWLSALFSPWAGRAMDQVWELAKVWLIALLAVNAVRSREQLRLLIVVWLAMFALFPVRGTLMNFAFGISEHGRYYWNFGFANPNDLAAFCILQIGLCLALLQVEQTRWVRLAALLGLGLLTFVILLTQSRGGMLALGTMMLLGFLRQRRKLRSLAVAAVLGLAAVATAPDKVFDRLGGLMVLTGGVSRIKEVDPEQSAASRYAIWRVAMHIGATYPLTGAGWGTYATAHEWHVREVSGVPKTAIGKRDAHGTYARLFAETGAVGLFLFLAVVVTTRRAAGRARRALRARAPDLAGMLAALLVGQLAYLQAAIFASYAHLPFLYLYSVIILLVATLYGRAGAAPAAAPDGGETPLGRPIVDPGSPSRRGRRGGLALAGR